MEILQTFSLVLCAIICILLILVVLVQGGKSGSMGIFGGGSANTAFGASTMDVVTKFTWWLAVAFFCIAILSAISFAEGTPGGLEAPSSDIQTGGGITDSQEETSKTDDDATFDEKSKEKGQEK